MTTLPSPPPEVRELTPEQEAIVDAFLARYLSGGAVAFPCWLPQTPDMSRLTAKKFLIARKFDIDAAGAMYEGAKEFLESTTYRDAFYPVFTPLRKYDVQALETLFPNPPGAANPPWLKPFVAEALECYQTAFHGWDRRGHPVVYEHLGRVDPNVLVDVSKKFAKPGEPFTQGILRWHLHSLCLGYQLATYNHLRLSRSVGHPISSLTVVWDTEGLSYGHLTKSALSILRAVVECDAKYFPELMHVVLVVNCPSMVRFAYAIVRPWLDPNIQKKIFFLAPGEETRETLARFIAPDQLPKEYGGLCECPEGCVPKPTGDPRTVAADMPLTEEIHVPAGGDFVRDVPIAAGESVAWEYVSTKGNDVAFGVSFAPSDGPGAFIDVEPLERQKRGEGQYAPRVGGTMRFVWDNKFSWMKGKKVTFRIIKT